MKRPRIYLFIWVALVLEAVGLILGISWGSFSSNELFFYSLILPGLFFRLIPVGFSFGAIIFSLVGILDLKKSELSEVDIATMRSVGIVTISISVIVVLIVLSLMI